MEFFKHLKTKYWDRESVGGKVKTTLLAAMTLLFCLSMTLLLITMLISAPHVAVVIFGIAVAAAGLWGVTTLFEEWGRYKRKKMGRW